MKINTTTGEEVGQVGASGKPYRSERKIVLVVAAIGIFFTVSLFTIEVALASLDSDYGIYFHKYSYIYIYKSLIAIPLKSWTFIFKPSRLAMSILRREIIKALNREKLRLLLY